MTAFKIDIPEENVSRYDPLILELADRLLQELIARTGIEIFFERLHSRYVIRVTGSDTPPQAVGYFAALAHNHPLDQVIRQLEEILSDETLLCRYRDHQSR